MVDRTRITAAEYAQLPETMTPMELIDGEIIVSPPPKHTHQRAVGKMYLFLGNAVTIGEFVLSPMDVYFDDTHVFEPDIFWVSGSESLCKLGDDDYWHGAPDLVIEILSPSTALRDRRVKFEIYQRHGVREYWLVDTTYRLIEVYTLVNGKFERQGVYGDEDTFISAVLGGLEIPVDKLI